MDLYSWCFLAHFLQMYVSFHWNLNFYEFPDESTSFGGIFCFFGGFFWFFLCFFFDFEGYEAMNLHVGSKWFKMVQNRSK